MGLAQLAGKISVADYLSGELVSDQRHEYIDGEVYAMAGTSRRHNQIAGNLYSRLNEHLRGGPCRPFISDLKVAVPAVNCFYYPDVAVTCDPSDDAEYYLTRPVLLVEVLSPSTSRVDRHEKLFSYQTLVSLQEYLLLAQDRMEVILYHRTDTGWTRHEWHDTDNLHLACLNLVMPLADLYL